jgi:hypothetical protein
VSRNIWDNNYEPTYWAVKKCAYKLYHGPLCLFIPFCFK